ncbi:hydrophobin [Moniliophthora roreri]|nr:hydrophobin [Moniliophthora roreri]
MYKAVVFFFLSFTLLAAALPGGPPSGGQCNTGPIQCCNSVQSSSDPATSLLLGLLGVVLQGINVPIPDASDVPIAVSLATRSLSSALVATLALLKPSAARTTTSTVSLPLAAPPSTSTSKGGMTALWSKWFTDNGFRLIPFGIISGILSTTM